MKLLVTGGAGFIGSHLVRALLNQGDEVTVFDCAPNPSFLDSVKDQITYIQGDSAQDLELYRAVVSSRAEGVLHCGGLMGGFCEMDPPKALQVNLRSTQVLLDACKNLGIKRFFYMSSSAVFRPDAPEPVKDDGPFGASNIYGLTKMASELLCRWYNDNMGMECRGVRPTWVWGPKRSRGLTTLYTNGLINKFIDGGPIHIDNPDEKGDWVYVHDAVQAILRVWNAKSTKQSFYNLCGECLTMRQVAEAAMKVFPDVKVTFAENAGKVSPYAAEFDDTPLRTELGYKPEYDIETSIRDYVKVMKG